MKSCNLLKLEDIKLSKLNQKKNGKYRVTLHICGISNSISKCNAVSGEMPRTSLTPEPMEEKDRKVKKQGRKKDDKEM